MPELGCPGLHIPGAQVVELAQLVEDVRKGLRLIHFKFAVSRRVVLFKQAKEDGQVDCVGVVRILLVLESVLVLAVGQRQLFGHGLELANRERYLVIGFLECIDLGELIEN